MHFFLAACRGAVYNGWAMTNTSTTALRLDISDSWHEWAIEAGLEHVDGWGNRSVFSGSLGQWRALWVRVSNLRSRSSGAEKRSCTAVLSRVGNNIATRLNIGRR